MAVEDGYNVERSVLGQNDANNEQDTSLVTPNADGSAIERLEYVQTLLASLDTATLQTLIEAIQGTGFSDVTDSLKVLSDAIDVINAAVALTGDAEAANVLATKTFYKDNAQTKLTGTMPNNAGDVASISGHMDAGTVLHVVPASGYTDGVDDATTIDLAVVDADLVTSNIKSGVTILGVAGSVNVVDTTEAGNPAAEADIANGKIAWVNGVKITGTHI